MCRDGHTPTTGSISTSPRPTARAEVTRLLGLGAAVQREADGYTVMSDPEGNQFCVVEAR